MGLFDNLICQAVTTGLLPVALLGCQALSQCVDTPTMVCTNSGAVQGYIEPSTGNRVFKGIPFAESTAGTNRFQPPVTGVKWTTTLNATEYGPTCPQASISSTLADQGNDCLNLNIWAPANGTNLPVFVYVYGGAMVTGGSSNPQWQGSNFASKDVIYVNFNYRESVFGAPNSAALGVNGSSQNVNILDVEAALDWVYANIETFGGNRSHVVVGGHSSGAVHVDHYLWNHPDSWLAGAIEMSANAKSGPGYAPQDVALNTLMADISNTTGTVVETIAELQALSVYDIETSSFNSTTNTWFAPIVDNITRYSDYEGRFAQGSYPTHVPLIVGNSDQEGALFGVVYSAENTDFSSWINTFDADLAWVPDEELLASYNESDYSSVSSMSGASYGDARFLCSTDYLLDLRASSQPMWIYRWFGNYSIVTGVNGLGKFPCIWSNRCSRLTLNPGPTHGTEVPFFHGGNDCFSGLDASDITEEMQALADWMNDWFVAWVKNPAAGPGWDKATPKSGPVATMGVPGNETEIIMADTADYNARCQSVSFIHSPTKITMHSSLSPLPPSFGTRVPFKICSRPAISTMRRLCGELGHVDQRDLLTEFGGCIS
ncbi:carboxylesterase [Phyllosticta capitalensis]|uniref:carboxylesterase n=1 Tax=Phyllosticta capitalensis TaxID=121624 RepID=UPI00312DEB7A